MFPPYIFCNESGLSWVCVCFQVHPFVGLTFRANSKLWANYFWCFWRIGLYHNVFYHLISSCSGFLDAKCFIIFYLFMYLLVYKYRRNTATSWLGICVDRVHGSFSARMERPMSVPRTKIPVLSALAYIHIQQGAHFNYRRLFNSYSPQLHFL